jgi:hypothetical protein
MDWDGKSEMLLSEARGCALQEGMMEAIGNETPGFELQGRAASPREKDQEYL